MIKLEAGGVRQETRRHPYLPDNVYYTASFFSARKHGRGRWIVLAKS
jgi:hypothetical protein